MKIEKQNMEQTILKAAEELFIDQGFVKTTTVQIAKKAGCNSAMVHYYYRTKEQLFERIYGEKIKLVIESLTAISGSGKSLEERVAEIIDVYFDFLSRNPRLPAFMLYEAQQSPADCGRPWGALLHRSMRNCARQPPMDKFVPFRPSICSCLS